MEFVYVTASAAVKSLAADGLATLALSTQITSENKAYRTKCRKLRDVIHYDVFAILALKDHVAAEKGKIQITKKYLCSVWIFLILFISVLGLALTH